LDTNVLYAALRSRRGASFAILEALWQRKWSLLLSNTVLMEYEEILQRESQALNLNHDGLVNFWMHYVHSLNSTIFPVFGCLCLTTLMMNFLSI
jgi:predicted nucleic acid-binding protein